MFANPQIEYEKFSRKIQECNKNHVYSAISQFCLQVLQVLILCIFEALFVHACAHPLWLKSSFNIINVIKIKLLNLLWSY